MFEILSIAALALLLGMAFFVTVTLHELGHAIPALMTKDDVTIYIGSFGSPYKSFHLTVGRLEFYCKYNPLLWYKGCCFCSDDYLSLDQRIWFVAGGRHIAYSPIPPPAIARRVIPFIATLMKSSG